MLRLRFGRAFARLCLFGVVGVAAQTSPRPLTHSDFDAWRNIATPQLSRDGRWLAYSFMPQDADGDLVLREVTTGREHRIPVGTLPPPPLTPPDETANPEAPPPPRNIRIAFTGDSRFAVASTHPSKAEVLTARKAKKKPEDMPKGGLVVVRLDNGAVTRVADVKNFQVPSKGGACVAWLKEPRPEDKKAESATEGEKSAEKPAAPDDDDTLTHDDFDAAAPRRAGAVSGAAGAENVYGTDLVLRALDTSEERTFGSVVDYSFARDGKTLLYTVSSRTPEQNGIFAVAPADAAAPVALLAGRGRYSRLTWDREQTQAVFVSDRDTAGDKAKARFKLYHWPRAAAAATELVTSGIEGFRADFVVSNNAAAQFSRDGRKLFVPAAPTPKPPRSPADAIADEDKVTADLWHWRDGFVQPMQRVRAVQERNRTFRGVLDVASKSYVQLADTTMASITFSDDGTRVLGYDDRAYRSMVDYDGRFSDIYLVNATTGVRKLALKQLRSEFGAALLWSPDGKWAAYYQDKQWRVLDTATGIARSLTAKLRVAFHNEDDDRPEPPGAYGAAGWTKDSASFLAYDRYDVWQLFGDDRPAKNLTAGHGRANKVQLRVQRVEPVDEDDDERGIDPAKSIVLRGESERTRATGFFRTSVSTAGAPERLLWGDKSYRYAGRARDADALLVTASRFDEFPDVYVTDTSFAKLTKQTDGGAQLAAFMWGRAELVPFRNADGIPLQATLYTPANLDPQKKYPLIVYLYERLSQNVHNFVNPAPGTSINVAYYVSNGYCVLMPDIVYKTGQPGPSALRCVLPALDAAIARGFIDEKAVGIQGHSWGGYQIAYMLTQTNRFRAAEAGAPVGNMTSAYSGIRWGSGLPRQFQYETGQSRIGRPLLNATKLYLDNSAIFLIDRVTTPLLIMSNDNDDAVPWYQGIELFLALRRQGKPAWLFNYNGEYHGLRRRADQKDWTRRMQQFFDHHLKGAPAPAWLEEGIRYIDRDEEKEQFNKPVTVPAAETSPVAAGAAP
jgi:dipeptidyl aminopeptidase/acylaminoacyl peptidase